MVTFIRHNVIGGLQGTRFETFVYGIAQDLRSNSDWDIAYDKMREFAPTDEQFKRQFIAAQISRQSSSRYILTEFEQNLRPTEELKVQTSKRVHIEHIYPQTPLQGERLPNHHSVVNRIGNQTLLAKQLNQSIQNAQFADKIAAYAQSDLLITKNLTKFTSWGEQAIDERQEMMSEIAPTIWKFEE